jgi:hypothetical protein
MFADVIGVGRYSTSYTPLKFTVRPSASFTMTIIHIVLFEWKSSASQEQIDEVRFVVPPSRSP